MNISTLMLQLSELQLEHGDIEVGYYNDYDTRFVVINQVWFKKSEPSVTSLVIDGDDVKLGDYFIAIE